jgi:hypothetical protein
VLVASVLAAVTATTLTACLQPPEQRTMAPVEAPEDGGEGDPAERAGRPQLPSPSWTGRALTGKPVTVSASDPPPGVSFVGGLPTVVARVDKLARAGDCLSLSDLLAFWRHQAATDVRYGAVASAFAQHTLDVATFIGCPGVASATSG